MNQMCTELRNLISAIFLSLTTHGLLPASSLEMFHLDFKTSLKVNFENGIVEEVTLTFKLLLQNKRSS